MHLGSRVKPSTQVFFPFNTAGLNAKKQTAQEKLLYQLSDVSKVISPAALLRSDRGMHAPRICIWRRSNTENIYNILLWYGRWPDRDVFSSDIVNNVLLYDK